MSTGLLLDVLRHAAFGDCTNNGASATHDTLVCVGTIDDQGALIPLPDRLRGPFAPTPERPAVALRRIGKSAHLVPVDALAARPMAGGNYATGDSRFREAVEALIGHPFYGAVSIHDRIEA